MRISVSLRLNRVKDEAVKQEWVLTLFCFGFVMRYGLSFYTHYCNGEDPICFESSILIVLTIAKV